MANFHGILKKRSYFEGWYFKNQNNTEVISFIPAFHIDEMGKKSVSIQVIMNTASENITSENITYPIDDFTVSDKKLGVRIANNIFSEDGIILNIRTERISVIGKLRFSKFARLKYDIMGPFKYVPFMQCRHSVYSLGHNIAGSLMINGSKMCFKDGWGYIEGDRGVGFPRDYLWTQCSWRTNTNNTLLISVADIPFAKVTFKGCIGVVYYEGKEYRFATYLGVKIRKYNKRELWVQQGGYDLQVSLIDEKPHNLLAPVKGKMRA